VSCQGNVKDALVRFVNNRHVPARNLIIRNQLQVTQNLMKICHKEHWYSFNKFLFVYS